MEAVCGNFKCLVNLSETYSYAYVCRGLVAFVCRRVTYGELSSRSIIADQKSYFVPSPWIIADQKFDPYLLIALIGLDRV